MCEASIKKYSFLFVIEASQILVMGKDHNSGCVFFLGIKYILYLFVLLRR